ncbi:MAG: hydrogenase subunit MbhD domain-containing protein [Campylobacterota bacterium]|nr:hydrogenase subunit MbhD domain-containing protein [Campylobacterota bacterium]
MIVFFIFVLFIMLIVLSLAIYKTESLEQTIVLFLGFGLISTALFFLFSAPDVALTEAVIGSGLSAVVFFITYIKTKSKKVEV